MRSALRREMSSARCFHLSWAPCGRDGRHRCRSRSRVALQLLERTPGEPVPGQVVIAPRRRRAPRCERLEKRPGHARRIRLPPRRHPTYELLSAFGRCDERSVRNDVCHRLVARYGRSRPRRESASSRWPVRPASESKAARSAFDPPPRTITAMSQPRRPERRARRRSTRAACRPWTEARGEHDVEREPRPDQLADEVAVTFGPGLATSPTRRGTAGTARLPVPVEEPLSSRAPRARPRRFCASRPRMAATSTSLEQEAELGTGFVEVERSPDDDDHPRLERRLPGVARPATSAPSVVRQHLTLSTGDCRSRTPSGIDEVHVAVARPVRDALDLSAHPHRPALREGPCDGHLHPVVERGDRQGVVVLFDQGRLGHPGHRSHHSDPLYPAALSSHPALGQCET